VREDAAVGDGASEPPIDPGWRDAWKGSLWVPTMFLVPLRLGRSKVPTLLLLRRLFVMYAAALVIIGSVRASLGSTGPQWSTRSTAGVGLGVAAIGLLELFLMQRFVERPLPCDAAGLPGAYRTRFFLRMAFADAPALVAFSFSFVSERWWLYLFGLAPAFVGFLHAAPTRAAIEREWRELEARDCGVNLLAALMAPVAPN
jgi:hypothetical protein